MNARSVVLPLIGIILCAVGTGLALYGNTLPSDVTLHSRYNYNNTDQTNTLTLIGLAMLPLGAASLLYSLLTRTKRKQTQPTIRPLKQPKKT